MAKWRYKLKIKDIWQAADREEITIESLAKSIASRIELMLGFRLDDDARAIIEELRDLNEDSDSADFNPIMDALYDWADEQVGGTGFSDAEKRCWIETF